jgi:hypothetical protein
MSDGEAGDVKRIMDMTRELIRALGATQNRWVGIAEGSDFEKICAIWLASKTISRFFDAPSVCLDDAGRQKLEALAEKISITTGKSEELLKTAVRA